MAQKYGGGKFFIETPTILIYHICYKHVLTYLLPLQHNKNRTTILFTIFNIGSSSSTIMIG